MDNGDLEGKRYGIDWARKQMSLEGEPPLSRRDAIRMLREVEADLGIQLLVKSGHQVYLSPKGLEAWFRLKTGKHHTPKETAHASEED